MGGLLDLPEELLEDAWFLPLDQESKRNANGNANGPGNATMGQAAQPRGRFRNVPSRSP